MKSKEVKTGCNLAEYSKEGYRSKRAAQPMMMMIMMIFLNKINRLASIIEIHCFL
jgi:hypothetical protein